MFMYVLFYLEQLSHFLSYFGAGVTNLNEPTFEFFAASPLLAITEPRRQVGGVAQW